MAYQPHWENGTSGRLVGGQSLLRLSDPTEVLAAINRRLALTYQGAMSVGLAPAVTPLGLMRSAVMGNILGPPVGTLGGQPPSPDAMCWLWPEPDADEGKTLVAGPGGAGTVNLFARLNGGSGWTDPSVIGQYVRAVHWNELRQSLEWIRRGRWRLPLYLAGGLFSLAPDMAWVGGMVGRSQAGELRTCGFAKFRGPGAAGQEPGLRGVDVLEGSRIEITADCDCDLAVYRCTRAIDFANDPPTWNQYAPAGAGAWSAPGGLGEADAEWMGQIHATSGQVASLGGEGVTAALQAVVDGALPNFTLARVDSGPETVGLTVFVVVEFDLREG